MDDSSSLDGRRILITGAGSGIGAATARLLARQGARIAILDRQGRVGLETAQRLGSGHGLAIAGDVTDPDSCVAVLDAMQAEWGGIDDLVNNAGTWDHDPLLELTAERWRRVIEVNLMAPIGLSNAAVRRMKPGGSIVNVTSVLGQMAAPARGPYCVSKSALITLTKIQAIEWAAIGIRVNAIAPGYIANETTMAMAASGGFDTAAIERRTPMGRFGTEAEVAQGIAWLLDPLRAAYVTGHVLEVSGGWTAYGFV